MNNAFYDALPPGRSTSLFAALDVNAKMHERRQRSQYIGWIAWLTASMPCKMILETVITSVVRTERLMVSRQSYPTRQIASDLRFFHFVPGEHWHVRLKAMPVVLWVRLLLTTPGIMQRAANMKTLAFTAILTLKLPARERRCAGKMRPQLHFVLY